VCSLGQEADPLQQGFGRPSNDELMPALDWISYMAIAALAVLLSCTSAQAATANEVLPACKLYLSVVERHGTASQSEISHLLDAGECLGAVYAMLTVSHTLAEPLKFCPPVEFDAEQGVRVVVAYIEKRPERKREDFTMIALEALRAKWPCR
jgi:hypothetical protein